MTRPTHDDELQANLDAAQAALERHLGGLKQAVTELVAEKLEDRVTAWKRQARDRIARGKAELERVVTDKAVRVVEIVRRPFAWLEAHALPLALGALAAGAAIGVLRFGYYRARCAASARLAT